MSGIVGHAPCTFCSREQRTVRRDKNGRLYVKCPQPPDGCGQEQWCRSAERELHLARRITRGENPEDGKVYLGDEALPAKAAPRSPAPPAERPEPEPELEPALTAPPASPISEPPAAPPRRRRAAKPKGDDGPLSWLTKPRR